MPLQWYGRGGAPNNPISQGGRLAFYSRQFGDVTNLDRKTPGNKDAIKLVRLNTKGIGEV